MEATDYRSEQRMLVLDMALGIEDLLSKALLGLFKIGDKETKTLSHKSSALSFKTKVDLLNDLGRIEREDISDFQAFMEIRNQFMHNLDATTFEIVIERCNKNKALLKLLTDPEKQAHSTDLEYLYRLAMERLCTKLFNSLLRLLNVLKEEQAKNIEDIKLKLMNSRASKSLFELSAEIEIDLESWAENLPANEADSIRKVSDRILKKIAEKISYNKAYIDAFEAEVKKGMTP